MIFINYVINTPMKVKKLREEAKPLRYAHEGDSGMDVFAVMVKRLNENFKPFEHSEDIGASEWTIRPGETVLVCSGWSASIPEGTELQVRPTSGNGLKTKMRIPNTPGTVDSKGDHDVLGKYNKAK